MATPTDEEFAAAEARIAARKAKAAGKAKPKAKPRVRDRLRDRKSRLDRILESGRDTTPDERN